MRYTRTHEWVELEKNGIAIVGLSDRGQDEFGKVIFVELPETGGEFEQDDPIGTIESVDGDVAHIHAPITGVVLAVNSALENSPELINISPEGDGWIVKMRVEVPKELNALMTAAQYEAYDGYDEDYLDEDEDYDKDDDEDYY